MPLYVKRPFLLLVAISSLSGQLLIDTNAGGAIPSGVRAQSVAIAAGDIAWDPSGNIVFCDLTNNVIRRIRPDGIIETIVGTGVTGYQGDGGTAVATQIDHPFIPVYDQAGNLYFVDSNNLRIRRVDSKGIITTIAGDGQLFVAGQWGPRSV